MAKFYLTLKNAKYLDYMREKARKREYLTRREKLYAKLFMLNRGFVPCYVCDKHVEFADATIEHIIPLSKGGLQTLRNLSISHACCNTKKADFLTVRKENTASIKRTISYDVWQASLTKEELTQWLSL